MTHRRAAVWANRSAGGGRAAAQIPSVVSALDGAGYAVTLIDAPNAGSASRAAIAQVDSGVDLMVVIGGDGTVHHALQVVAQGDTTLAVIPAGSGDDIAQAFGIARNDPHAALDTMINGHIRMFDLGRAQSHRGEHAESRWFGATLYAGFDARVNARANAMRLSAGRAKYPLAVIAEIARLEAYDFQITRDGDHQNLLACAVVVGNGPSYGGGMLICPDASATDGWFDLTIVEAVPRRTLLRVLPRVYSGQHVHHSAVSTSRAQSVILDSPGLVAYADGEVIGALPLRVEAVSSALRVRSP